MTESNRGGWKTCSLERVHQLCEADREHGAGDPIQLVLGPDEMERAVNVCVVLSRCEAEGGG